MLLVEGFLDLVRAVLFGLSQLYGGNLGAAILTLPIIVRLLLLPLNVRLALAQHRRAEAFAALRPEIDVLKKRYERQPERLADAMQKLLRGHRVQLFDVRGCLTPLLQWPLWASLYVAVQQVARVGGAFLWVADISRPDRLLAALAAVLTYVGITVAPSASHPSLPAIALFVAVFTFVFVFRAAAGVGLYWVGSAAVSVIQSMVLRHLHARGA